MKKLIYLLIFLSVLIGELGISSCSHYEEKIETLRSMEGQQIKEFKVYPKVDIPIGTPILFNTDSSEIIDDFFQSLSDISSYAPTHDRVASQEYSWFVEVNTPQATIQISCYIPYGEGTFVVGILGDFNEKGGNYDGYFKSQQLYDWYQTYSHRWLTPENDRDSE